jgi:peroxiredoxin
LLRRVATGRGAAAGARTWVCSLLAALLLGATFAGGAPTAFAAESLLNKKAPEFTLRDLNGGSIDLASFRGKVVLLDFWATWCAPCQVEMPRFAQWQRQYGPQGFQVIGISMDDDPALARKLYARLKLNYPVAMGDEELGHLYGGVLGLPLTYLIDRNGNISARFQGEPDLKAIETRLKALLSKP